MKKNKKHIIIICIVVIIILVLIGMAYYNRNKGKISGIVVRDEQQLSEEIDYNQSYYGASVEIFSIKENNGKTLDITKPVIILTADKDGKFTTNINPGKYKIYVYYGDKLKSDIMDIEVKPAKVSWLKVYIEEQ